MKLELNLDNYKALINHKDDEDDELATKRLDFLGDAVTASIDADTRTMELSMKSKPLVSILSMLNGLVRSVDAEALDNLFNMGGGKEQDTAILTAFGELMDKAKAAVVGAET